MTFEGGDYYSERQSDGTGVSHDEAVEFAKRMAETQTVPDDVVLMVYRFKKGAGLQPTAEWSRIQQALKELEMYQNGQADYKMVRDQRDELAAELERWETNFSHAMDTANDIYEQKLEVLAEIESVKAGTIKELEWIELHENHFVAETFGDTEIEIWLEEALDEPEWHWGWVTPKTEDDFPNTASSLEEAKTLAAKWHYEHVVEWLMPTAESCAAHEGKEGENDEN